jgi:hypothetical protein
VVKRDFVLAAAVAVTVVAGGVFMAWYNNKVVLPTTDPIARYTQEPGNPLSFMSNWDGPNYLQITQHGYTSVSQTNFFPLYPIATRVVHFIVSSPVDAALIVAWLCFVGAIYFYLKIVKYIFNITNNSEAFLGLLPFILFPTAVFLIATYPESLFAFLSLGAIYSAMRRNFLTATGFLLFATASHITGLLVLAFVVLILLEQKVNIWKVMATVIVGSLGLVSYGLYLLSRFHNFFAFISSQESHGWLHGDYLHLLASAGLFNVIFILLLILAAAYWWSRRKSLSIYSLLFLLIPLVGRQFGGFNRYVLLAIPIPLMLYGYLRNKKVGYLIAIVVLSVVWAYFLFQYAAGYNGG